MANVLTGGAADQTDAGTYAVTADFVPTDAANYNSLLGQDAGNFVIEKATPTATLAVNNSPVTYDGTAKAATVGITVSSVPGAVANILTGGAASQTDAGTYAVTADFVPADSANYNSLIAQAAGNFVIEKATPTATLAVNNSPVTYDATAKTATVGITVSSVPGAVANVLTGGAASQTGAGTYPVTADFVPTDSANYNSLIAQAAGNFVIEKATPTATLAVNNSPVTYDGTVKAASVGITVSSVPGAVANILTGGAASQTDAGTYAVTASFVPTDSANYNSLIAQVAGNFVIEKATPTATLAVNNSPVTYDGTTKAATVGITVSSVPGAVANILTGGAANQTDAGTYAVTANFVPTDSANYNSLIAQAAGNFVIEKATPTATLAVNNSPATYDGTAKVATVGITSSSVPGAVANILTGGAADQTDAGTYAVKADFVPTDSANYNTLSGQAAGNFVIEKVTVTITSGITADDKVYDGTTSATISSNSVVLAGVLPADALEVDLSTNEYTASFSSADVGSPIDVTVDGLSLTGAKSGDYALTQPTGLTATIGKAAVTITSGITADSKVYDGTTSATISSNTVVLSGIQTADLADVDLSTNGYVATFATANAGSPIAVTVTGLSLTGTKADQYVLTQPAGLTAAIDKATPTATLAVNNSPVTYDGTAKAATVGITVSSVPGAVANTLTGGAADQTDAGTYAVTADFVPNDSANYNSLLGQAAGNFVIEKATPTATLAVDNSPMTYDGTAKTATVGITVSSVPGAVANILTGGAASQTDAGTYAVTADFMPTDSANYNSLSAQAAGNFVIEKATPTVTLAVNNSPVTYDGTAKVATVGITVSSVPGAVANILTGGAASQTDAGTYAVTADFMPTDSANYNSLSAQAAGNFVIEKATPTATLAVNNSPLTYDGTAKAATVGITVSSVPGAVANILTGGAAGQTDAGTYAVTANFVPTDSANYNSLIALAAGNLVIEKATPTATLAVNNSPVAYSGTAQAATVGVTASSVPGAAANILTGGAASQTDAGTYAVTADFVPTDSANYNSLLGLAAGNFVIDQASSTTALESSANPSVQGSNVTFTATVSSTAGTPTGDVVFKTNGVTLATVALVNGVATASTSELPVGTNTVAAEYAGQGNYMGSNVSLDQVVVNSAETPSTLTITDNADGTVTVTFAGTPDAEYVVQAADNVAVPVWTNISTNTAGADGQWTYTEAKDGHPARFYRSAKP